MLEGVLYTVVSKEENSATVRLIPESPIYKAHFPEYPITPGVTLLQIALELMGKKLVGAKEIKFVAPVLPGDGTEIRFEWEFKDENTVSVSILSMDGTQYARMSLSV
jgi:3-hydroxyacyl-[acyl-carrier-protein] dehydratase